MHKEVTIEEICNKVLEYDGNKDDIEKLKRAYNYASDKHFGQKRISGEDYIYHPMHVAMILADIKQDIDTICAGILHDTIEDCSSTFEEVENLFGKTVANLVDGVTKINKIHFSSSSEQMAVNQRKILVGLANDPRVIIIKLADRLHNMRTLDVMPREKQKKKAKETLEILTPVAHRLGIYKIKSELEDLCLRYLKPDVYSDILEKLNNKKTELDESVRLMIKEVSSMLSEHGIKHEIKGRTKGIYSIYNKLNKGKAFKDIYDILAMRVFVETEAECYLALGLIHSKYKPFPKRFKDYIAMPKTNMYQSLHTTVFGIEDRLYEIQIRTYEMDKIAEYGIASHWSYKENGNGAAMLKDNMERKLQIFRNIIELNEETSNAEQFIEDVKKDFLLDSSIYIYTPKGDVIELPQGSTVVDFAYRVHTEVGNTMVAAIVNDVIVPFDCVLKTGDIAKINTNKASRPSKDWLNFVVTSQAKNRIKAFYNKINKDTNLEKGIDLLEREIKKNKLSLTETLSNKNIEVILNEFKLKNMDELYIGIGSSKYSAGNVLKVLLDNNGDNKSIETINDKINRSIVKPVISKNDILVQGISEIKVNLSSCCKPILGDAIIGHITKGSGITVHRSNCNNIASLEDRLIQVSWNELPNKKYPTDLQIYTDGRDNLIDIISKAGNNNIVVDSISTVNKGNSKIYRITVYVENLEALNKYIVDLNNLSFIKEVERKFL